MHCKRFFQVDTAMRLFFECELLKLSPMISYRSLLYSTTVLYDNLSIQVHQTIINNLKFFDNNALPAVISQYESNFIVLTQEITAWAVFLHESIKIQLPGY